MTVYEGNGPNVFGHIGVGVNSEKTTGLYPSEDASTIDTVRGRDVPGVVKPDQGKMKRTIVIPTSPEQDAAAQAAIDERTRKPGSYNLYEGNCTSLVRDVLDAAGIETSPTIRPNRLFDQLEADQSGK